MKKIPEAKKEYRNSKESAPGPGAHFALLFCWEGPLDQGWRAGAF
jgi:hypothetical protein